MKKYIFSLACFLFLFFGASFSVISFVEFIFDIDSVNTSLQPLETITQNIAVSLDPSSQGDSGQWAPYIFGTYTPCNEYGEDEYGDWVCVDNSPDLCPYIFLTPNDNEEEENQNEGSLYFEEDPTDSWTLSITSPCFEDECPTDYDNLKYGEPLPIGLKGKTFKCELTVNMRLFQSRSLGPNTAYAANSNIIAIEAVLTGKQTAEGNSSVLFIPGFMASDLYVQDALSENQLWPPTSLLKTDIEKLMLDTNGNPVTPGIYTKSIMGEAFGFNIYKSFVEKMDAIVANGEIKEWEGFPYDWRKDISKVVNEDTIVKVGNNFENKKLIDEAIALAQRSPTKKIIIIGHSNGGLVGKYLIKELSNQGKANIVDQFVMVATPQIGTPKAIAGLLHGDQQEIPPFVGILMNKELAKELGYNIQSAYNLLPSQSYFNNVSDSVIKFEDSINQVFDYSVSGFPQSINTFGNMFNFITSNSRGIVLGEPTNVPSILRSDLANNANTNIDSLANWQIPSNIEVSEIAGWGENTTKGIEYRSKQETICSNQGGLYICQPQYVWDRELLMTNDGDGTVVIPSAINYNTPNKYYLNLFDLNNARMFNLKHHNILEASQLLEMLSKIFTKSLDTMPNFISIQKPISINQNLQLSVHSPVSLGIYSNNLYTGPSSTTPTDAFTFIKEEIPNSYYLEIGEDKYIGLPKNGNYVVNLQGEGVGTFTFNQKITQDDQVIDSKSFVDIPIIPLTKGSLSINDGNLSSSLDLDIDGNGSIDVQVQTSNGFDAVAYLTVMKSVIKTFNLNKPRENNLINKIDNLIKLIRKGKIQKASIKADVYVKKLNSKLGKINTNNKKKDQKLTEEEIQIIIQNLEEFINNLK